MDARVFPQEKTLLTNEENPRRHGNHGIVLKMNARVFPKEKPLLTAFSAGKSVSNKLREPTAPRESRDCSENECTGFPKEKTLLTN